MVMALHDIDKALDDLAYVRSQLAKSSEFRGHGPITLAATALLAVIGAALQWRYVPDAAADIISYLGIWIATGAVSLLLIAVEVIARTRRVHSGLADQMLFLALEQMFPSVVAGTLVTWVLVRHAPDTLWILPGLWQILLSLGMFASSRSVPRTAFCVGVWYMLTGLICLALAHGANAFSPFAMGLPFGIGQLFAAILFRGTARTDAQS